MARRDFKDLKQGLRQVTGHDYSDLVDDLSGLPKAKLIKAIGYISDIRKRNFTRKKRMLGNMSKALTESMFQALLATETKQKFKVAYFVQGMLALRVSEVARLKVSDFDFENKRVFIHSLKTDQTDTLPLPSNVEKCVSNWIEQNREKIHEKQDYIFFSDYRSENHISDVVLRGEIREKLAKVGQNVYATSSDGRRLNLYSSHSLRAYGISRFYRKCGKDTELTRQFARHDDIKDTVLYLEKDYQKMEKVLRKY
jgi:integrase